ncbi:hypothetical protein B5P43_17475 [Bacillus sp. SRB_336]|nr:hypothetical protein B5P43_17475 [Bacillus sp. SRB_336]
MSVEPSNTPAVAVPTADSVSTYVGQGVSETLAVGETPADAREGIGDNVGDGTDAVVEAAR